MEVMGLMIAYWSGLTCLIGMVVMIGIMVIKEDKRNEKENQENRC